MIRRLVLALLAVTFAVGACGSFGGGGVPANAAIVRYVNATSVPVEVRVNGAPWGTIAPWTPAQEMAVFGPGGPPWRVGFLDPDGFELGSLDVDGPARPGEASSSTQTSTCGTFAVWWGAEPPAIPVVDPAASPPPPPPCS